MEKKRQSRNKLFYLWSTDLWPFSDERIVSSIKDMGQLDSHMQNNVVRPYVTRYRKINSKWIILKLLEGNTGHIFVILG